MTKRRYLILLVSWGVLLFVVGFYYAASKISGRYLGKQALGAFRTYADGIESYAQQAGTTYSQELVTATEQAATDWVNSHKLELEVAKNDQAALVALAGQATEDISSSEPLQKFQFQQDQQFDQLTRGNNVSRPTIIERIALSLQSKTRQLVSTADEDDHSHGEEGETEGTCESHGKSHARSLINMVRQFTLFGNHEGEETEHGEHFRLEEPTSGSVSLKNEHGEIVMEIRWRAKLLHTSVNGQLNFNPAERHFQHSLVAHTQVIHGKLELSLFGGVGMGGTTARFGFCSPPVFGVVMRLHF